MRDREHLVLKRCLTQSVTPCSATTAADAAVHLVKDRSERHEAGGIEW